MEITAGKTAIDQIVKKEVFIMDLGSDISSEWCLNEFGDLDLVSNKDNIIQAIINRLSCDLDSLQLFYSGYGSVLSCFFGWKPKQRTLDFMKIEIENVLAQDERIKDNTVSLNYSGDGDIAVNIEIIVNNELIDFKINISENGVELNGN